MQNDKKMYKNHLNFILPDKIGKCTIRKDIEKVTFYHSLMKN